MIPKSEERSEKARVYQAKNRFERTDKLPIVIY